MGLSQTETQHESSSISQCIVLLRSCRIMPVIPERLGRSVLNRIFTFMFLSHYHYLETILYGKYCEEEEGIWTPVMLFSKIIALRSPIWDVRRSLHE